MDTMGRLATEDQLGEKRSALRGWGLGLVVIAAGAVAGYAYFQRGASAPARPAPAPPQVVVSQPLQREIDERLGFLGQFSAVERVELRAQVGGTLTEIQFKDGDIVKKGAPLFAIDPVPYEIRLAQATATLAAANARLDLGSRELGRAQELKRTDAGTAQNVDQRLSERLAAIAAVDQAKAQIRDAQFDLDHCRITAPFTGKIGSHLVSTGNLISGSRAGTSPTTMLALLVSVDPIYLDFDMSEADFRRFAHARATQVGQPAAKVEIDLSDGSGSMRQGSLDFVDNALDRSSGTIHARATVPNPDGLLTPGEFARVRVVVSPPAPRLLVPDTAVLPDQSAHIVLTAGPDGTVAVKPVELGDLRDGLRVIRTGLAPTDRVIIEGIPFATPGGKVTAQDGTIAAGAPGKE